VTTCPHCAAGEPSVWDSVFEHYAHQDTNGKLKLCHEPWRSRIPVTAHPRICQGTNVPNPVPDLSAFFELLGRRVKDKVSAQEGVCDALTFDLYGCIQAAIAPSVDKDGKFVDGRMLDVHRLWLIDDVRVMPTPSFPNYATAFGMLGKRGRDRISGMTGVLSSIGFELCDSHIRIAISPPVDKEGKLFDGRWMSISRIEIVDDTHVMPVPTFSTALPTYGATPQQHTHGPADGPSLSTTLRYR